MSYCFNTATDCYYYSVATTHVEKLRKEVEAVYLFRRSATELEANIKIATERLAAGPIRCFVEGGSCKTLEDLSKLNTAKLFETKDAKTSILNTRAPLVLGSDVNARKRYPKKSPQFSEEWKRAAAELLAEQKRLVKENFGDYSTGSSSTSGTTAHKCFLPWWNTASGLMVTA